MKNSMKGKYDARQLAHKLKVKMKKEKGEERDIISNLPDHIILHIISRLSTDEAVRTSVLSPRWKHLWKGINRICVLDSKTNPQQFAHLVDHILKNCSSTNILSFELSCPQNIQSSQLTEWISRAYNRKIEELIVGISTFHFSLPDLSAVPKCILYTSSLITLKLHPFYDIQIPEPSVCFPFLKLLDLELIFPIQCSIMHRLLSSCPVLEKFFLSGHLDSGEGMKFDICGVPTLMELLLHLQYEGDGGKSEYDITIDAPNLTHLTIMDDSLSRYVVKNVSSLRHVDIMYETTCLKSLKPQHAMNLLGLMTGVSTTQMLTLRFPTMDVLTSTLGYSWPLFLKLTMIELNLYNSSGWTCFPVVLHSAPFLEVLILDLDGMTKNDMNDSDEEDEEDEEEHPSHPWIAPNKKPLCLFRNLKVIGIKCVKGNEDELRAIEYLLKNAQALNRVWIEFHSNAAIEGLAERILTFPRASATCDVKLCSRVIFQTRYSDKLRQVSVDVLGNELIMPA